MYKESTKKTTKEEDINNVNKEDLAAVIQSKMHLNFLNRQGQMFYLSGKIPASHSICSLPVYLFG